MKSKSDKKRLIVSTGIELFALQVAHHTHTIVWSIFDKKKPYLKGRCNNVIKNEEFNEYAFYSH